MSDADSSCRRDASDRTSDAESTDVVCAVVDPSLERESDDVIDRTPKGGEDASDEILEEEKAIKPTDGREDREAGDKGDDPCSIRKGPPSDRREDDDEGGGRSHEGASSGSSGLKGRESEMYLGASDADGKDVGTETAADRDGLDSEVVEDKGLEGDDKDGLSLVSGEDRKIRDLEDGRDTPRHDKDRLLEFETEKDRVSIEKSEGKGFELGRSDEDSMGDAGHSLLMHMYKTDEKDYESLVGDYDLKAKGKRALQQTNGVRKDNYREDNFYTNKVKFTDKTTVYASNSDKIKSMVKPLKEKRKIEKVDTSRTDTLIIHEEQGIEETETKKEEKLAQHDDFTDEKFTEMVEEEIKKEQFSKRKDLETDEHIERIYDDRTNENGDRNNNVVDHASDEEKLRARANWLERTQQNIEKQEISEKPDLEKITEGMTFVCGSVSSSGVEGSSERSDSDESIVLENASTIRINIFPSIAKRYDSLSKKSATSDSVSDRDGEIQKGALRKKTETVISRDYVRTDKDKKRVLVKLLPIKQDFSSSDSPSADDVLPSSDLSERRVRRIKKEKRGSNVTLVEVNMAGLEDSCTSEGGLTSSESIKRNISDSVILDLKVKHLKKVTISENMTFLSKSDDNLNETEKKELPSPRVSTPLRQASYKIAVKNGDLTESAEKVSTKTSSENAETVIKLTENGHQEETKDEIVLTEKKMLARKVSYEMAVRRGTISVSPSPTLKPSLNGKLLSVKSLLKSKSLERVGTPPYVFRPIDIEAISKKSQSTEFYELIKDISEKNQELKTWEKITDDQSQFIETETFVAQSDISEKSHSGSTTTQSTTTSPQKFSNYEKILPLGGILTLIKGKALSETSGSQLSMRSLSWDHSEPSRPSKAQSLDSLPSALSQKTSQSTPSTEDSDTKDATTLTPGPMTAVVDASKSPSIKSFITVTEDKSVIKPEAAKLREKIPPSELRLLEKLEVTESPNFYDEMMRIMLGNDATYINKTIIHKKKNSSAKESSFSGRKFLIDGEVILLEDDLPICKDCNIASVQILWARQIIARLDDTHVYANLPPYSENLTVIRRILAKTSEGSDDEMEPDKAFHSTLQTPKCFKTKKGFLRKKGSRRNVSKFVKGAIGVIPELDEETLDEDRRVAKSPKASIFKVKGCKRRNITRKAYAYDLKRIKKHKDHIKDDLDVVERVTVFGAEGSYPKIKKPISFKCKLDDQSSASFKTYEDRCSLSVMPYVLPAVESCSPQMTEVVAKQSWSADVPLKNYSVRFTETIKAAGETDSKAEEDFKPWWKMFTNRGSKQTKVKNTEFVAVPISMNLVQHGNGRLEIMYGHADEYPYTVGEYSIEDGRYLTLEEYFLKRYHCYQPPEDYFFNIRGRNSNLTVIKMSNKSNFSRATDAKIKQPPFYIFRPTKEPGECPNKKSSSAKQILQQWFTRGGQSGKERGFIEKPMRQRRTSMPYLPSRRLLRKPGIELEPSETPPILGPKPKKDSPAKTDSKADSGCQTEELLITEMLSNVKNLAPGTYYYPYIFDDKKPTVFLEIIVYEEDINPEISYHCVEGHAVLQDLIKQDLVTGESLKDWENLIFKMNETGNGVSVQKYNLNAYPPALIPEEIVKDNNACLQISSEIDSLPFMGSDSDDLQSEPIRYTDKPKHDGFKFSTLRDSITHKPLDRPQRRVGTYFVYDNLPTTATTEYSTPEQDKFSTDTHQHDIGYSTSGYQATSYSPTSKTFYESQHMGLFQQIEDQVRHSHGLVESAASEPQKQHYRCPSPKPRSPIALDQTTIPRSGRICPKKPPRLSIATFDKKYQPTHSQWSCPSTSAHSPTQLTVDTSEQFHEKIVAEMRRSSFESLQRIREAKKEHISAPQPSPTGYKVQSSLDSEPQPSTSQQTKRLSPTRMHHSLEERQLPHWYLPRKSRTGFAQKSTKSEPKINIPEQVEDKGIKTPIYANVPLLKETREIIEKYEYPWEYCSPTKRLLIQDKLSVQRRKSTGETKLPRYEHTTALQPCDDVVLPQSSELDSTHDAPLSINPIQVAKYDRQQQLSPSYYSLSHYPIDETRHTSEICPSNRTDGTYSELDVYPHATRSASRHSIRSINRFTSTHPWIHAKPPTRSIGTSPVKTISPKSSIFATSDICHTATCPYSSSFYIETDSELEPFPESSSSYLSSDAFDLHTYPCARHSIGNEERMQVCRMKGVRKKKTQKVVKFQGKDKSKSSEFLEKRVERRYKKRTKPATPVSHSDEDIAERIAYHFLDSDSESKPIPKRKIKKKRDRYAMTKRISHSSEDIANRIAFHFVGDTSQMTSCSSICSSLHGRPIVPMETTQITKIPTKTRSTSFLLCTTIRSPEHKPTHIKDSPIWGTTIKRRTSTV